MADRSTQPNFTQWCKKTQVARNRQLNRNHAKLAHSTLTSQ